MSPLLTPASSAISCIVSMLAPETASLAAAACRIRSVASGRVRAAGAGRGGIADINQSRSDPREWFGAGNSVTRGPQPGRERILRGWFTMHEIDIPKERRCAAHCVEPCRELRTVSMRAVAIKHFDACTERNFFAVDLEHRPPLDDAASERVLCLKPDNENGVSRIRRPDLEMVQDPARFCHPRRR